MALAALGLSSCDHSPTVPQLDQLALDVVSGDGQTAIVGTQMAPLIVKVTSGGNPVAGQVLNFRVVSGGGSVYGGTELTDEHGIAQELWTLGTKASESQKVEVRAVESNTGAEKVFGTFTATALPRPASLLKLAAGDQQAAGVGQPVATPAAVLVSDQYGNPVAGTAVTFAVTSGGGSVTGASAGTGANGIATVGSWTLGPTAGTNTLKATSAGLTGSPLTFTATGTGPAGLNIANYAGDGQTQPAGSTLPVTPAAQVTDQNGHAVAGVQVTFSVTAGGGSITGPTEVTDVNGIAMVGSWTLGPAAGVNELKATFNTSVSRGSTIFVATGTPATCAADALGLVSWWPGEGNGNDIAGGNNGALQGGATFGAAEVEQGFNLVGPNDFVRVAGNPSLQPTAGLTMDAWVNPSSADVIASPPYNKFISKDFRGDGTWAPPFASYILELVNMRPYTEININGGLTPCSSPDPIPVGSFAHVAATYDGASIRVYVDGVLKSACSAPSAHSCAPRAGSRLERPRRGWLPRPQPPCSSWS